MIFTSAVIDLVLEGNKYQWLEALFTIVAAFVTRSREHTKTTPITRAHTRYSTTSTDVIEDIE